MNKKDQYNLVVCSLVQALSTDIAQRKEAGRSARAAANRVTKQTDEVLQSYELDAKEYHRTRRKLEQVWATLKRRRIDSSMAALLYISLELVETLRLQPKYHRTFDRMAGSLFTLIKHLCPDWETSAWNDKSREVGNRVRMALI